MENPTRDIEAVIRSLTQGTRQNQEDTLKAYFLPNAYFVHPFCWVPSFAFGGVKTSPLQKIDGPDDNMWPFHSRYIVQLIYQWYKILSPSIDLTIDSAAFDAKAGMLYVTIRQSFTMWVVPFNLWQANVKLVSVLELAQFPAPRSSHRRNNSNGVDENGQPRPSYAEVAADRKLWYIKGQEDHYQVNQWLKFVSPFAPLWSLWQLLATCLCIIGVAFLWPVTVIADKKKDHIRTRLRERVLSTSKRNNNNQ